VIPKRPAVVLNPASVEDSGQLKKDIRERCAALGIGEPLWFETTRDDPGAGMVAEALSAHADLIVVCGGDGNLLARNLHLPLERGPALDVALGAGRRRLDLLESDGRRFVVMAGLGFDAEMIRDTSAKLKAKLGWPAYVLGVARALRRHRHALFEVTMDDAAVSRRSGVGVLIGNVGRLQGGLAVLPDAQPDDGLLDVALLTPHSVRDWPVLALRILLRKPNSGDQAEILRGRRVQINIDRPMPLQYDGEVAGDATDITVRVLPAAIVVCSAPI
jgi:diacylglycerol kinase (ATP)